MIRADKHGSSLFVYEKENQVCNISLSVDSDCRDEEDGHVPSIFWFEIFCRGIIKI